MRVCCCSVAIPFLVSATGDTFNVMPNQAWLGGTVLTVTDARLDLTEHRIAAKPGMVNGSPDFREAGCSASRRYTGLLSSRMHEAGDSQERETVAEQKRYPLRNKDFKPSYYRDRRAALTRHGNGSLPHRMQLIDTHLCIARALRRRRAFRGPAALPDRGAKFARDVRMEIHVFVYNCRQNARVHRIQRVGKGGDMLDLSTLATFVAVVLGLFLIPGPAVLLVLTRTVHGGRKAGILTGLGIAAGDFMHTLGAAVGLSALLMTSALAFNAVKFVGAAYLVYLGVRALREKKSANSPQMPAVASVSASKAFFQAIPAELLNPKTALFFLAFLPQFVRPEHGSTFAQFITLGLIFVGMSALYTTLLVVSIGPLGKLVKRLTWLTRWQNKIIGVLFISLGLRVASQTR